MVNRPARPGKSPWLDLDWTGRVITMTFMTPKLQWLQGRGVLHCLLAAWALVGVGCTPCTYNIELVLDPALKENNTWPSLEVDLVGVSPAERAIWASTNVNGYFDPANGSSLRRDLKRVGETAKFNQNLPTTQLLPKNHPRWKSWNARGVVELFVLVNLPIESAGVEAQRDQRVLILPLDCDQWDTDTIRISIHRASLGLNTPQAKP